MDKEFELDPALQEEPGFNKYQIYPSEPLEESQTLPVRGINKPVASLLTLAELLPLNYAVLATVQSASGNHVITALSFAGATMMTEIGGAIGSAKLIEDKTLNKPIAWAHRKLEKMGIGEEESKPLTDFVVTVAGGTVVMNTFKQVQNPERTRKQNKRYGILMGIGNSAVSGVGIWLATEGIYHPDPEHIAIGSIAVFSLLGAGRALKSLRKRSNAASELP